MSAQFLKRLIGRLCPHRFSWPHSGLYGRDYQVCLICGASYEYDWTTMRRTGRMATPTHPRGESFPGNHSGPNNYGHALLNKE